MHLKAYLQPKFSYGWAGGPQFETRIVPMANGRERRNANWDQPQHKFTAPYQHLSDDAFRSIKQHFMVCKGRARAFLFRDELDYLADDEVFGVGDGDTDTFQLAKLSVLDSVAYQRDVFALYTPSDGGSADPSDPTITADNSPTSAFTVDHDRGQVVFNAPPANGVILRWSGAFSLWVRFDSDWLPFSFDEPQGTYGSIDLIEVAAPVPETSP